MYNAVRCNVEVLQLTLSTDSLLKFPSCVFFCGSLRSLSVDVNYGIIRVPSSSSSNLVSLRLVGVTIEEGFWKWISCCCKCLKELLLEGVEGGKNITIESSSLEAFEIYCSDDLLHLKICGEKLEHVDIFWSCVSSIDKSFIMSAPNLNSLSWGGKMMNHLYLAKLLNLEKVQFSFNSDIDDLDKLCKFLYSIRGVKFLVLEGEETMRVLQALSKEGLMPVTFLDIHFLGIGFGQFIKDGLVLAMVSLFRAMPNLNTLYVRCDLAFCPEIGQASGFTKQYWELQNLTFISQLKEVIIELIAGSNGIELARYMLEHAQTLKKLVIVYFPEQSDFLRELKESKKMSNAIVVFQERKNVQCHCCSFCGRRWFDCRLWL